MDNSTVFQFILHILSLRLRFQIPAELGVRFNLGTVCIGHNIAAVVVARLVIRREVAQTTVACSEGCGEPGILDNSTVFALNRAVPRERRSVRWSVKALICAESLFFFITGHILFDDGEIHISLGSVGEILETTTARLLSLGAGAAVDRNFFSRRVLQLFGIEKSGIARVREAVITFERLSVSIVLGSGKPLSDLAHPPWHLDSFQ